MFDAIYPQNLPVGGDAYLGYADGRWPDYAAIAAAHNVPVYALTVFGSDGVGVGVDCEPGDATVQQAAEYIKNTIAEGRVDRPIAYVMESWAKALVDELAALGVPRAAWRLLTAHYGNQHICGPSSCGCPVQADGTQWSNPGPFDESVLSPDFITAQSHPGPIEEPVTAQDIANIVAALTPVIQAEVKAVVDALNPSFTLLEYGDSPDAAFGRAPQGHPFNLFNMSQTLNAVQAEVVAVTKAVAAVQAQVAALPTPEAASLKGETASAVATITFN